MIFRLAHDTARQGAIKAIQNAPEGWVVRLTEPTRTLEQNALLWPLLHDLEQQVDWYGQKLTDEDWKDLFTAQLKKSKIVPAIDGKGFVACGLRSSHMGKAEFSMMLDMIQAFGAEHDVKWSEHVG